MRAACRVALLLVIMTEKRTYRNILVAIHWLSAVLVFAAFGIGLLALVNRPNNEEKIVPLGLHMALGIAILFLTIVRYFIRLRVYPPWARIFAARPAGGRKPLLLDEMSKFVHPLLYIFTLLMSALGLAIAFPADLFGIVFGGSGAPLPEDFYAFEARDWHGILSLGLMLLIGQHILAALFHQFIKGENFLGRMWFVKGKEE